MFRLVFISSLLLYITALPQALGNYFGVNFPVAIKMYFYYLHVALGFCWLALIGFFIFEHLSIFIFKFKLYPWQYFSGVIQLLVVMTVTASGIIAFFIYPDRSAANIIHIYFSWGLIASSFIHLLKLLKF